MGSPRGGSGCNGKSGDAFAGFDGGINKEKRPCPEGADNDARGHGFSQYKRSFRQIFDLYACVRPCKSYKGVRSKYSNIDLVLVRENTEDLYAGVEFEKGKDDTAELINWLNSHNKKQIRPDSGISIKPISVAGTERIVQYAFDYARNMGRMKVTSVHKANIMKFTDGLWLEISRQVAAKNSDIEFEDRIVDNMCMQLSAKA